jgi:hypothetical protein
MSTRRERNLTKMQAERNVLILREGDREQITSGQILSLKDQIALHGDSSDFMSDDHHKLIESLQNQANFGSLELTERERKLIVGINGKPLDIQE